MRHKTTQTSRPICVDLCCGEMAGWTKGFSAAGFYCIGVDVLPLADVYPGDEFVQADIRELDGGRFAGVAAIMASPPCDEFSRFRQPWLRAKGNLPDPDLSIVEACYRVRAQAQPGTFILENVRSAQYFLGQATVAREPFYFWGDAVLIPRIRSKQKQSYSSTQKAARAEIPLQLAYAVAMSIKAGLG